MSVGEVGNRGRGAIVRAGLLLLVIGFGGFIFWATVAPLSQGVVATGIVAVDGKRKTIQHLEGGIIAAIHVRDGDVVEAGELLIELEQTRAGAEHELLRLRLLHTLARVDRLQAERNGLSKVEFTFSVGGTTELQQEIIQLQQSLFHARKQQLDGQVQLLQQRTEQLRRKVDGLEVQQQSLSQQKVLVADELKRTRGLYKKQLIDLPQVLKLEKEQSQIQGEMGRVDAEIAATEVAIGETGLEILQVNNNRQQEVAEEILLAREQRLELQEQLAAAEDVLRRTKIYAPEEGVVFDLAAHTVGGVVAPGTAILDLVPKSHRLVVEARVQPSDIDNVFVGMAARVRLTAFKQRTTPILWGEVEFVSADALEDQPQQQSYYLARIVIPQQQRDRLQKELEVLPGMPVEVLIEAGERTAMEYFIDPIEDVVRRGLREQ